MKYLLIATSLLITLPSFAGLFSKDHVEIPDGLYHVRNILDIPGVPVRISEENLCVSTKERITTQNPQGKAACEIRTMKDTSTELITESDCLVNGKMHYTRMTLKLTSPTTYETYLADTKTNKTSFSAFYTYLSPCKK